METINSPLSIAQKLTDKASLINSEKKQAKIKDILNNNEVKYSFIIDHWFRKTIMNESVQKEIAINEIIISYLRKIFRFIDIPKRDHSYNKFKNSVYLTQEQYQWGFLYNIEPSRRRTNDKGEWEPYSPPLKVLNDPNNSINFDLEFVFLLTYTQASGRTKVKLLKDDIDIDQKNHCITFTIEVDRFKGNGTDDMAYYAWCVVINKRCNFTQIAVKTDARSIVSSKTDIKYIYISGE